MTNPTVTITMSDGGVITAELYPTTAPITVQNFVHLIKSGFYNGLGFHRVSPTFMIQGGCPDGTGTGGPAHRIKGEFAQNGVANDLSHSRGVLSMARSQSPNSAGSQFFIMTKDSTFLDGGYAAFGKVTSGMDVVDRIATQEGRRGMDGTVSPTNPMTMTTVTVDTHGVDYDPPEMA